MRDYLICYDIADAKRLRRVAKAAYQYALGGQKSALEAPMSRRDLSDLIGRLEPLIDPETDRINIVPFRGEPVCLGRGDFVKFDEGVIVL